MAELEYWTEQIKKGRISRREFMGRAAALGVTAAAASTLLTEAGVAAEPKKGGNAKFGLAHGATSDTMDPAAYPDTGSQVPFWGSMSNSLTEVDAKGNITMDLAESMEPSDGAKTWACKLKKGVTFHNGKDFTADDVVASFRYHMGKDSKSAAKAVLEAVTDIKADDKNTVIFKLSGGNADFPYIASDYHIPMMPANADGSADWKSGVRTGPFVYDTYEPGVKARLKRYANYHKSGKPYFDSVEFITISDVTARTNALTTGEVHWMSRADLKTLSLLGRNPDIAITELTGYGHYVFPMDVTQPPFDKVEVRQALKWAINRDEINKKVLLGHGVTGNDSPIAPSVKFATNPQPRYTYDPEKAKSLLQKAGMSNLKVNLSVAETAFVGATDAAVLYQEHAKAAGIDINVVREPNDGYWDNVWLKKAWCADYWGGRPTADWMFTVVYAKGAAWNETKWANPRFNELLVIARAETDEKKRADMYTELQQLVHDDGGALVLVFNNYVDAHSKKLAHGDIAPNWEVDGLRIAERWWFA
jgi:peptide/nickel transport system substrate-binding protein